MSVLFGNYCQAIAIARIFALERSQKKHDRCSHKRLSQTFDLIYEIGDHTKADFADSLY